MDFQMPLLSHLTMFSSRERLVYGLEVLLGYQRILDPRGTQTLEGRMSKKKKGPLWKWKREVCIIRNMMAIAQSNELKFQKLPKTSPILGRRSTCWTFSSNAYLMKDDVNDEVPNWTPKILIPFDHGVVN